MHTILNPNNPNHEWFEELCALAAIGELGAAEFRDLQEHLAGCTHCRHLYADFCRISADDIGLVAIQGRDEQNNEDGAGSLDEQELLGRILSRTRREQGKATPGSSPVALARAEHSIRFRSVSTWQWLKKPALAYGVLALLLAAGAGAYRFRDVQQNKRRADLESRLAFWKNRAETRATEESSAAKLLEQSQVQQEALQKSLR